VRVKVSLDVETRFQTIDGFGATTMALANTYPGIPFDTLGDLRRQVIDAVYGQVGINLGNIDATVAEPTNDDGDPYHFNWEGFDDTRAEPAKTLLIDLAEPLGFKDFFFGKLNTRWFSPWLRALMRSDYQLFLDECAEHLVATMVYWRDHYGVVPRLMMPFNEPLSGNRELADGTPQDVANIIRSAGDRLRQEGFHDVMFVAPNEETEEQSLETAEAILADPGARKYIAAIGYHPYPYGSIYASVPRILNTSGRGSPDPGRVAVRHRLRDLGRRYGLPVWMSEISHPEVDPRSFDHLRGRAIHIHDEFIYADASAYFAMNNMWDLITHRDHFDNDDLLSEADTVALANNETGEVMITGMGYAIGHYARWVRPGAVRVAATSEQLLLQPTAFWDDAQSRVSLVMINNADDPMTVDVELNGLALTGPLDGERSTGDLSFPASYWQPLAAWQPDTSTAFSIGIPPLSVTSIAGEATVIQTNH
jgi:O-glycosyl hydrolase